MDLDCDRPDCKHQSVRHKRKDAAEGSYPAGYLPRPTFPCDEDLCDCPDYVRPPAPFPSAVPQEA